MRSLILAASLAITACHGTIDPYVGGDDAPIGDGGVGADADLHAAARADWETNVAPLLEVGCQACHANADATGFLNPDPDAYDTMMAWPSLVDLESPSSSRLLTKGAHEGPAWQPDQKVTIRRWIDLEVIAAGPTEVIDTPRITPVSGPNSIPLDDLGLPGATVHFDAELLTMGLYLSNLAVTGGPDGAHVKHPLFVTWMEDVPSVDPVDSFDSVELDLAPAASGSIGGGLIMLPEVPSGSELSINFELAEPFTNGDPPDLGGCDDVPSFTANARTPLSTSCVSCHGGTNAGATGATDMTKINDTSTGGQTTACGQILSRINLLNPNASGLFVSVDPAAGANHPFKFGSAAAFTTFKNAVSLWITAENAP